MPDKSDISQREDGIRRRAYQLWEEAGKPDGQDQRFWNEAEQEIDRSEGRVQPPRPPTEPTREERVPGRIEPPIMRDDPAGPPVGTPQPPRR